MFDPQTEIDVQLWSGRSVEREVVVQLVVIYGASLDKHPSETECDVNADSEAKMKTSVAIDIESAVSVEGGGPVNWLFFEGGNSSERTVTANRTTDKPV